MADSSKERLPHFLIKKSASTDLYTRPQQSIILPGLQLPQRDRQFHAQQLLNQIAQVKTQETDIIQK
ncbi:MAG: hypothetical protein ACXWTT_11010 [Methylobacter sp.]